MSAAYGWFSEHLVHNSQLKKRLLTKYWFPITQGNRNWAAEWIGTDNAFFHLNRFFFDCKMTMPCFNNFIYWLIKQIMDISRNYHFQGPRSTFWIGGASFRLTNSLATSASHTESVLVFTRIWGCNILLGYLCFATSFVS